MSQGSENKLIWIVCTYRVYLIIQLHCDTLKSIFWLFHFFGWKNRLLAKFTLYMTLYNNDIYNKLRLFFKLSRNISLGSNWLFIPHWTFNSTCQLRSIIIDIKWNDLIESVKSNIHDTMYSGVKYNLIVLLLHHRFSVN